MAAHFSTVATFVPTDVDRYAQAHAVENKRTTVESRHMNTPFLRRLSHPVCTHALHEITLTIIHSKIRGHCWLDPSPTVIRAQYEVLKGALAWDVDVVSKRTVKVCASES